MELALNIVWLALSAGLILLLGLREPARLPVARHRVIVAIALTCLIAFLFPVISITDDLNSRAVVAETVKTKHWAVSTAMLAFVATGFFAALLSLGGTRLGSGTFSKSTHLWQKPLSFHCSRRPPPANS